MAIVTVAATGELADERDAGRVKAYLEANAYFDVDVSIDATGYVSVDLHDKPYSLDDVSKALALYVPTATKEELWVGEMTDRAEYALSNILDKNPADRSDAEVVMIRLAYLAGMIPSESQR